MNLEQHKLKISKKNEKNDIKKEKEKENIKVVLEKKLENTEVIGDDQTIANVRVLKEDLSKVEESIKLV